MAFKRIFEMAQAGHRFNKQSAGSLLATKTSNKDTKGPTQ